MELKEVLNKQQYDAVTSIEGPLLILAGAGSGKTRVLTYRIAHMVDDLGIYPSKILAITFTNKAAGEMKERLRELIGDKVDNMWVSTFHSCCVRILRREIDKLGYNKNFVIYDTYDQKVLIKDCMKELNINEKDITDREIINKISNAKDNLITCDEFKRKNEQDYKLNKIADVYILYQKKLKSNNALDFDDIIFKTVELFKKNKDVLEFYHRKFKYIMVDEYQDTNRSQYELVNMLAKANRNICVVGDDDQCIYEWRGADIRNILDFNKDYPEAKVIKLEQNYRSKGNILKAANSVIKNNSFRTDKKLKTSSDDGEKIKIYRAYSDIDEAMFVEKTIKKLMKSKNKRYKDFAILYRTNAQSRIFEETFIKSGIPYRLIGGTKFYDRKEVKDILAYLRLINNPVDDVSLKRIINVPKRSIGAATVNKISNYSNMVGECMYSVLLDADTIPGLTSRNLNSINKFISMLNTFILNKNNMTVSDLIREVIDKTQYMEHLKKSGTAEDKSRIKNLEELVSDAVEFENTSEDKTLSAYLEKVTLISDIDNFDEKSDSVVLMTVHSAKGLEFPIVFMVGMENGIFPSMACMTNNSEMEEARRLCYVGITRAKQELYMTSAEQRRIFGRMECYEESDFIREIPESLKEYYNYENELNDKVFARSTNTNSSNLDEGFKSSNKKSYFDNLNYIKNEVKNNIDTDEITVGCKIKHSKFETGIVVGKQETNNGTKITVVFDKYGIKNLMLNKAPIELVK